MSGSGCVFVILLAIIIMLGVVLGGWVDGDQVRDAYGDPVCQYSWQVCDW